MTNCTFVNELPRLSELVMDGSAGLGFSLPPDLGGCLNLTSLTVLGRVLGEFPPNFFSAPRLRDLYVSLIVGYSGPTLVPVSIANLTELETVFIAGTSIGGDFPALYRFPRLKTFVIQATQMNVPDFTGCQQLETFSFDFGIGTRSLPTIGPAGTPNLKSFMLRGVSASVKVPWPLRNCSNIETINLASVSITGPIAPEIFTPALREFNLYRVEVNGSLPSTMRHATGLQRISLSELPFLVGDLPSPVGGFPNLTRLELQGVGITGLDLEIVGSANLTAMCAAEETFDDGF